MPQRESLPSQRGFKATRMPDGQTVRFTKQKSDRRASSGKERLARRFPAALP